MKTPAPEIVDRGPRQISRSIMVNAPVETLFSVAVNPHRHHEWDGSGTVSDNVSGPQKLREGDRFTVSMKAFRLPYKLTSTATEIVPNAVVEWQHPGKHRWRYEFESIGASTTKVTETWDYRESPAAKVFEVTRFIRRNTSGIEKTLQRIATHYE